MPSTDSAYTTLHIRDSGLASGAFHMYADAETLGILQANPVDRLVIRIFQWDKPTVSFGYLLNEQKVKQWAADLQIGPVETVKRPTGGGAVLHSLSDLSFSLAWRREHKFFSDRPRDCYAEIHQRVLTALKSIVNNEPALYAPVSTDKTKVVKDSGSCMSSVAAKPLVNSASLTPVCFNEPVCNDVMINGKKVIGGALRITKNAILYQGTVQLTSVPMADLKNVIRRAFA